MSKIISLKAVREIKAETQSSEGAAGSEYAARIQAMDKLELLEEMVRFQEERTRAGELSSAMMLRGRILFKALEETAETQELKLLTSSYRRHLEHEIESFLKTGMTNRD